MQTFSDTSPSAYTCCSFFSPSTVVCYPSPLRSLLRFMDSVHSTCSFFHVTSAHSGVAGLGLAFMDVLSISSFLCKTFFVSQKLRKLTTLAEDPGWSPSTTMTLTTAYTSSSRRIQYLLFGLHWLLYICGAYKLIQTHVHTQN